MRSVLALLILLASAALARAADAEFVRIWPGWREAAAFDRIGEYVGDGQPRTREIALRTRADARAGYYFLVRVKHAVPLAGGRFVLHLVRPDAADPVQYAFPVGEARQGETVFQIGLTGVDWTAGKDAHPVAWKLELLAADGRPLAQQKSFLWENPAK